MRQDAEAHAEEDKKKKELIEARNDADGLIYTAEKTLKEVVEAKKDVKPEDIRAVEDAITELKAVHTSDEAAKIKEKWNSLSEKLQVVGMAMYQQGADAPTEPTAEADKSKPEDGKEPQA
jgi:molecular chaperone DnaK